MMLSCSKRPWQRNKRIRISLADHLADLLRGAELKEAVRFANQAASISVQGFGVQGGIPTRGQIV